MPRFSKAERISFAKKDLETKLSYERNLKRQIKKPLLGLYKLICTNDYKLYPDVKDNPVWAKIRANIKGMLLNHYRDVTKGFVKFQAKQLNFNHKDVLLNGQSIDEYSLTLFERMAERQADIIMVNTQNRSEEIRNSVVAGLLARYIRDFIGNIDISTLTYGDAVELIAFLRKVSNRADLIGLVETRNSAEIAKLITALTIRQTLIRQETGQITKPEADAVIRSAEHADLNLREIATVLVGAEVVGYTAKKEWNAILDDRTRSAHAAADGQVVNVDDDFIVDGEPLMYPGDDSRASIGNTINCRCSAMYFYE